MCSCCHNCRLILVIAVAVLEIVVAVSEHSTRDHFHFIRPTVSDFNVECPPTATECQTLAQYINHTAESVIEANTAIFFLPGIHLVNDTNGYFVISNTENITLSSYFNSSADELQSPSIVCHSKVMFAFINVTNLEISDVNFYFCGYRIGHFHRFFRDYESVFSTSPEMQVALMFLHVNSLIITELVVSNSSGYGVLGVNILGESYIFYSWFQYSNAHLNSYYNATDTRVNCDWYLLRGNNICQGGNMLMIFTDPLECSRKQPPHDDNVLVIGTTVFSGGVGLPSLLYDSVFATRFFPYSHGAGFSAMFFQQSYGVSITLIKVDSFANRANTGANFYFLVSEITTSTSIHVFNSKAHEGHMTMIEDLDVLKGGGLAFHSGVMINNQNIPTCPQKLYISGNLLLLDQVQFLLNAGFEGAGTYISLELSNHVPHTTIVLNNCTYLFNIGITGAGLVIEADLKDLGLYSVRENFLDPLEFYSIVVRDTIFVANPPMKIPFDFASVLLQDIQHTRWKTLFERTIPEYYMSYYYESTRSVVFLNRVENVVFERCKFTRNSQTAVTALNSMFTFKEYAVFLNNRAVFGGAIALLEQSVFYITQNTTVVIHNNTANRGGGIYASNSALLPMVCFFQYNISHHANIKVLMQHNKALEAGDDVYGALIDKCTTFYKTKLPTKLFEAIFHIENNSTTSISSAPEHFCYCDDNKPVCDPREWEYVMHKSTYPGGSFAVPLVAVGQRNGTVPGFAYAEILYGEAEFAPRHVTQEANRSCTELEYSLSSQEELALLSILPQKLAIDHPFNSWSQLSQGSSPIPLLILVHFLECPPGFVLNAHSGQCSCVPVLAEMGVTCDIVGDTPLIKRQGSIWIHLSLTGKDVIVHSHCPFDFCESREMWLDINDPDSQCAHGHSGILCGKCSSGLSLALGSSQCKKCSSFNLFLLIPFLMAGIVLIIFLLYCNVTVSEGTINGLIFYANIVRVNNATFFKENENISDSALYFQQFLSAFVAWLNLDLGIETCLYDGMDAYTHTWLQFLYPIYLWVLVGALIILCHYSTTAVKVIGTNAVKVLATLFLLSYAKLQRTIINVLSFTYIDNYYPDGSAHVVWLSNGNVPYLQGAHIPLFLMAMAALAFTIPFTLFVLCTPCIQSWSQHRPMQWIHRRFKPLLDAYQAPFKDKFRYWAGLMLVVRNLLFVVFALNVFGDPNINLNAITTVTLPLLMVSWTVHKSSAINALEISFILNLSILSAWTLYNRSDAQANQTALVCTSTAIAFALFLCITLHHFHQQLKKTRLHNWLKERSMFARKLPQVEEVIDNDPFPDRVGAPPPVSCTYIELREPLELLTNDN